MSTVKPDAEPEVKTTGTANTASAPNAKPISKRPLVISKQPPTIDVEAFNPPQAQNMNELNDFNNQYIGIREQEEKTRVALINLQDRIHEIRSSGFRPPIYKPIGGGWMQPEYSKKVILKEFSDVRAKMENGYVSIIAQREHRADELGEKRVKAFKMLGDMLIKQHKFTVEDLTEFLMEQPLPSELPSVLPLYEVEAKKMTMTKVSIP